MIMSLLITGIGALVIIYGGAYLHGHPALGRFYSLIILFMTAMLGVVLSENALLLFIFWELTSISSFLLIGFNHDKASARSAAWQALLVTGSGGLAMLAGLVLIAQINGAYEISGWINDASNILADPRALPAFLLILLGAMTKSAQFPFHFWLPNAMEAPTPVSTYLHSATMVKAGIYLLARFLPVFSASPAWTPILVSIGLLTFLGGSLLALAQTDLKRLLAYTTVASLGGLCMLLGFATPLAVKTAIVFLVTHALYKGALFLVAGGIDHAAHTREIDQLAGLGRAMPFTATAGIVSALSMAGLPPLMGFLSKELLYETTLEVPWAYLITSLTVIANIAMVGVAGWVGIKPFIGKLASQSHPHEGPPGLWGPPLLLALLSLSLGILASQFGELLVAPSLQAITQNSLNVKLALWHGITPMLILSFLTVVIGLILSITRGRWQKSVQHVWNFLEPVGPAAAYPRSLHAVTSFAAWQTRWLQSGHLRQYVLVIVIFTLGLSLFTAVIWEISIPPSDWGQPRFYDVVLIGIILTATILVTRSNSRLATIALLGSIGFSIALIFLLYSAPDLAMVQFAIETLTVILFVLVVYRLPHFSLLSSRRQKVFDAIMASAGGLLMVMLMLIVSAHNAESQLAYFFAHNSLPLANGRNIVNTILVDFRGIDTLGEISVLSIAAIGVYTLIRLAVKPTSKV
jgi:multicomponent Na+:H+ antiporter subunit A